MRAEEKAIHSLYWYGDLREIEVDMRDGNVSWEDIEDAKEYMRYWHGESYDPEY